MSRSKSFRPAAILRVASTSRRMGLNMPYTSTYATGIIASAVTAPMPATAQVTKSSSARSRSSDTPTTTVPRRTRAAAAAAAGAAAVLAALGRRGASV